MNKDDLDFDKLRAAAMAATPGPWSYCGETRGGCQCGQIWVADCPIATAQIGEWADEYPAIRTDKDGKQEAYMERIPYGSMDETQGKLNAIFIATFNPALVLRLLDLAQRPPASPQSENWRNLAKEARTIAEQGDYPELSQNLFVYARALDAAADACDDMERGWAKALIALTSANADNAKLRALITKYLGMSDTAIDAALKVTP